MKLKKITLQNIRSYKKEEISFPAGSVLLSGDIGSGKTSVLLAVEYALFGLQPGQRGSSLLSNNKNEGYVKLELQVDEKEITIERSLKRGSKSVNQDSAAITIDGERIESSVTEIKTKILDLLNYPIEFIRRNNLLYRYTVYTPQEEMKQIVLEDPESRLNILRHVFGIDKYKRIKENIQRITGKLREESRILQIKASFLEDKKDKLESNTKFVNILNKDLSVKEKNLTSQKSKRESVENDLESLKEKVRERENFKKEIEKTQILVSSKKEQLSEENNEISEIKDKITKEDFTFNEQEEEKIKSGIAQKNSLIEDLNKYLIEISSKLDSINIRNKQDLEKKNRIFKIAICPTCLQDVSERHKHNILNETEKQLNNDKRERVLLLKEKEKTINNLKEKRVVLKELEAQKSNIEIKKIKIIELNQSRQKLAVIEKAKQSLEKDISFLESHVVKLKESTLEFTKFDNLLELKKLELKKSFELEKKTEIEIAEIRKELEITIREISSLEEKIEEGEKTKEKIIHLLDIENWLSGKFNELISYTEKNIMATLRKEFTIVFNKWFLMLTTDAFNVYLDETFSPIIAQGDFELPYSSLSGGERTAVALAYRLALNQIINSLLSKIKTKDLVILDEPTDGFSEIQLDKVRDILQELNMGQLIIVSHEQKIEGFVDNVIHLKKQNGHSLKES